MLRVINPSESMARCPGGLLIGEIARCDIARYDSTFVIAREGRKNEIVGSIM